MMKNIVYLFSLFALLAFKGFSQTKTADSVKKPVYVPSPVLKGFYLVKGIPERLEIYNNSLKQYPDTGRSAGIGYNYARITLATDYAALGDFKTAEKWVNLTAKDYRNDAILHVAEQATKNGNFEYAGKTLKPIIDSIGLAGLKSRKSYEAYNALVVVYAKVLKHSNQNSELVKYIGPLYLGKGKVISSDQMSLVMTKPENYDFQSNLMFTYANALAATGKSESALQILSYMSTSGMYSSPALKETISKITATSPNGKAFYQKFTDSLIQASTNKLLAFAQYKVDVNGKPIDFKSLKGKYFLLDFWGSWCGPCRASHPHLKELYNKYKGSGFEIVGIAQESGNNLVIARSKWTEAIAKDGLTWLQVLDNENIKAFSAVNEFAVTAFPTKILLDKQGNVIAKYVGNGVGGEGFTQKLAEIFGK
ncbi:TlpA family protein disulfide reductase [Pedobacter paludis]|uniref:Thioredoxin domain-containing protein n=1 Tax=Pedobacter paludis TaxID=2203212 RepID=A0A317F2N5_9SPHI|nr:TlpA disulfide reductase family protein [Pedobacter paludis]PWS33085.1 hypothetical protein DF947_00110 [Pedobacter paludis]